MSLEVRPLGVRCNIACQYCYQNPQRDAGNVLASYDMDRIFGELEKEKRDFTLFGGEPLLMPFADLEKLWEFGFRRFGRNTVQTNGSLIDDAHIELFHRYNVHVGISMDGPGELNDVRWAGSPEKTRAATEASQAAIERLCREKRAPSIIITLHRGNAAADRLETLTDWVRELDRIGVRSMRLHLLESESAAIREKYALSTEENLAAYRAFLALQPRLKHLKFDVFSDMRRLLAGDDRGTTCIWNACDPYTTKAVQGLEGNGQRSNCGRTNKDGIDFVKADVEGFERYAALYHTPQEHGGCRGCRFFLFCKGQCPGTAIDGDWRNRTEHCGVWKGLYRVIEEEMLAAGRTPLSLDPMRPAVESDCVAAWQTGRNPSIHDLVARRVQRERPIPS